MDSFSLAFLSFYLNPFWVFSSSLLRLLFSVVSSFPIRLFKKEERGNPSITRMFLSSSIPTAIRFQPYLTVCAPATLSTRLRPFSTCIFIRCVNNYRGHKTWYTADADLYIAAAIDAPSHGWSTVRLADRPLPLHGFIGVLYERPPKKKSLACVQTPILFSARIFNALPFLLESLGNARYFDTEHLLRQGWKIYWKGNNIV